MVQRKEPSKLTPKTKEKTNRHESPLSRETSSANSTMKKMKYFPNYMKPTSSSDARKDYSQVTGHNSPSISITSSSKKTFTPKKVASPPSITSKKNPTKPFLKRNKSRVLFQQLHMNRATCSSTLKDSKFPKALDLNPGCTESEGTSVLRVCPYTYCSLNGHFHEPLPPLKSFLASKRKLIKAQQSMKLKGFSPFRKREPKKKEKEVSPLMQEVVNNFIVEIYASTEGKLEEPMKIEEKSVSKRGEEEVICTGLEQSSDFSVEEMDAMVKLVEYVNCDQGLGDKEEKCLNLVVQVETEENNPIGSDENITKIESFKEYFDHVDFMEYLDVFSDSESLSSEVTNGGSDHKSQQIVHEPVEEKREKEEEIETKIEEKEEEIGTKIDEIVDEIEDNFEEREEEIEAKVEQREEEEIETKVDEIDEEIEAKDVEREEEEIETKVDDIEQEIEAKVEERVEEIETRIEEKEEEIEKEKEEEIEAKVEERVEEIETRIEEKEEEIEEEKDEQIEAKVEEITENEIQTQIILCSKEDELEVVKEGDKSNLVIDFKVGDREEVSKEKELKEVDPSHLHNINANNSDIENTSEVENTKKFGIDELSSSFNKMTISGEDFSFDPTCQNQKTRLIFAKRRPLKDDSEYFRKFNPRAPNFLDLEPEAEGEKVDLRHQSMEERKNAEEYLIDYALRKAVDELAPARKKKVQLLVAAFEIVVPVHGSGGGVACS